MKKQDLEYVVGSIGKEGFNYCFRDYSSFDKVKDKDFHKLRKAYVAAAEKLEDYLKEKCEENELEYDELLG